MTGEQVNAFRDRLMNAVVAAQMDDVAAVTPIDGEDGVIGVEFRNGDEAFIEIHPA